MSASNGRLSALLSLIQSWEKMDPQLLDKQGFLQYLERHNIGRVGVVDHEIWLKYYHEARKRDVTIAELLFDRVKEIRKYEEKRIRTHRPSEKARVDVVSPERLKELRDISSRLWTREKQRVKKQ